ncbi:hypothetical protein V6R86_09165 [Sphingomonas kaistensis]|jgi:hypothetical protein|uniref:Uncharacterized protein n=1 Tax=Sphingomonas kaistensis TaxID=298708 RepID=A0ABZ2G2P0_9SPHN
MAKETREERRDRQQVEVEKSQRGLRDSVKKTQDLLDEADEMMRRHRRECEEEGD